MFGIFKDAMDSTKTMGKWGHITKTGMNVWILFVLLF